MTHLPTQPFWPFWTTADFQVQDPWKGGPRGGSHRNGAGLGGATQDALTWSWEWPSVQGDPRASRCSDLGKEGKTILLPRCHSQTSSSKTGPSTGLPIPKLRVPLPHPQLSPASAPPSHGHVGLNSFRFPGSVCLPVFSALPPSPASQLLPPFWPLLPPQSLSSPAMAQDQCQHHSTGPPQRYLEEGHRSNTDTHTNTHTSFPPVTLPV